MARHVRSPLRTGLIALVVSSVLPLTGGASRAADGGTGECAASIDPAAFTSAGGMESMMRTITGFGSRTTASPAHRRTVDFLEDRMRALPGMDVRSDRYDILRWRPTPRGATGRDQDLARAGGLSVSDRTIPVAGAVPYSAPTSGRGTAGQLVRIAAGEPITEANAAGKVVLVDFPTSSIPFDTFASKSYYATPDLADRAGTKVDTAAFADRVLDQILVDAGLARAAGVVVAFDVPRHQVRGYFEPHRGTHYRVPAVFVGVDERERLTASAERGATARVRVDATIDKAETRNLIATLPGRSSERMVINANTDGNTWVQENGVTAMVALARYFAGLPLACRPRTVEFVFATAHLHISREGTIRYAEQLDKDYDQGTVAFATTIEHLGAREIVPVPRENGAGRKLVFSGEGEPTYLFATPADSLVRTAIDRTRAHGLDNTMVMRGLDTPDPGRVPRFCSFGGIGGTFNSRLIPTLATISGPWSLWAPSFGAKAVDFDRAHRQTLAIGDAILALQHLPRETLAGPLLDWRAQRAAGAPTCPPEPMRETAPAPPS
ncbi:hypothetical protein [Amycolatopsis nigrescens]|uniref:hypothetical protein n=1 Tax=Amycolatopsis nigrescens TaxID=381445 RepID=UPI0003AAA65E|nr:hypothetical protein [Amycolatopsis nigrescens]